MLNVTSHSGIVDYFSIAAYSLCIIPYTVCAIGICLNIQSGHLYVNRFIVHLKVTLRMITVCVNMTKGQVLIGLSSV